MELECQGLADRTFHHGIPPLLIQEKGLFWLDPLSSEPSHNTGISTPQKEVYWALGIPCPEEGRRETLSCELWTSVDIQQFRFPGSEGEAYFFIPVSSSHS